MGPAIPRNGHKGDPRPGGPSPARARDGQAGAYRTAVCHECGNHLDSRSDSVCPRCGWIICPDCGSCGYTY
jgi:hypothetical protein